MAQGMTIHNLLLEQFSVDPDPIPANRIWINSIEDVIKYSILNGEGNIIVRTVTDVASLNAAVSELQTAINNIQSDGSIKQTTNSVVISVGATNGESVLFTTTDSSKLFLSINVVATEQDKYDIELFDGTSSGTLFYKAQQITGSYIDKISFYQPLTTNTVTARIINLRQDSLPFSATVNVITTKVV